MAPNDGALWWDFSQYESLQLVVWPLFLILVMANISIQRGAVKDPTNISNQLAANGKLVVAKGSSTSWNRVTRHPTWWSLLLVFIFMLLVFPVHTSLLVLSLAHIGWLIPGMIHQDKRIGKEMDLKGYFAETSFVPFAAILQGRNRFSFSEIPTSGLVVGFVVAASVALCQYFVSIEAAILVAIISRAIWMLVVQMITPVMSYVAKVSAKKASA